LRSTEGKLKRNRIRNGTSREETGIQNLIELEMFTMARLTTLPPSVS
jgi:hypothetical protein